MIRYMLWILAGVMILPGCVHLAPQPGNLSPENLPQAYTLFSETEDAGPDKWWEGFRDPVLNRLIETALEDNFTLREAWARLRQTKAGLAITEASLKPSLKGHLEGSESRTKSVGSQERESGSYALGIAAGYEIDLWGKNRFQSASSARSFLASEADLKGAAITVAASVTETWLDLISAAEEKKLLEKQVTLNETLLKIQELRFEKSQATALDVLQQMEVLDRARAQIPPVMTRIQLSRNSLAFILGREKADPVSGSNRSLPDLPPLPELGLPADLLSMRPDIRAAGLRLRSADWSVSAARADRLPSMNMTGKASFSEISLTSLLDGWILNLAASVTGTLFDAGRKKAEVDKARAVVEERLAFYEKTVFNAVREVEDSLASEINQKAHIKALAKQLRTAETALEEAKNRYSKGLITFLPMLTELISVQNLQREMIQQKTALLKIRVGLYRALGGDWVHDLMEPNLETKNG